MRRFSTELFRDLFLIALILSAALGVFGWLFSLSYFLNSNDLLYTTLTIAIFFTLIHLIIAQYLLIEKAFIYSAMVMIDIGLFITSLSMLGASFIYFNEINLRQFFLFILIGLIAGVASYFLKQFIPILNGNDMLNK